mmetsp:Transcript_7225/g.25820  ORF Transcript_7225/g.25820 Transcript_7225/m.25820 type:complete len:306 (-) Transcript_7225:1079-1996(-)
MSAACAGKANDSQFGRLGSHCGMRSLKRYQPVMEATTPVRQPATDAQNCALGDARSRWPVLKDCMTSVDCVAPLAAMLAAIRLGMGACGVRTAKSSCDILPTAPVGVVSVSPVHWMHMTLSGMPKTMAMTTSHHSMSKYSVTTVTHSAEEARRPTPHTLGGTMCSGGAGSGLDPSARLKQPNAAPMLRYWSMIPTTWSAKRMAMLTHNHHSCISGIVGAAWSPDVPRRMPPSAQPLTNAVSRAFGPVHRKAGPSTPYASTAAMDMTRQFLRPVKTPAPKMAGEKLTKKPADCAAGSPSHVKSGKL